MHGMKNLKFSQIAFRFVEEGPGRGSEDIKKKRPVDYFDFFFFSVFVTNVMGGKTKINSKELHQNRKRRNTLHTGKELEAH